MTTPIERNADGSYWDDLYERAHVILYRTAALMLSPEEAEDVVQEAFERALRTDQFAHVAHEPVAWLRTVTARIALDRLRRRQVWARVLPMLQPRTMPDAHLELREALRRLPARDRVALVLRYYQRATYEEIGEALSLRPDSVGAVLSRAKRSLREAMRD